MSLNNQWVIEEIKEKMKKYLETNDSENMTIQNVWDIANAVLRGNFIAKQSYLKKQEKSQIKILSLNPEMITTTATTTNENPKLVEGKKS